MVAPAQPTQQTNPLQIALQRAYQHIRDLEQKNRELNAFKQRFFDDRNHERAFRAIPGMMGTTKDIALELRYTWFQGQGLDAAGRRRANLTTIATNLDKSSQTVRNHLERLELVGLIYDVSWHFDIDLKTKKPGKNARIFYKWEEDLYQNHHRIDTSKLPEWGGARPPACECGHELETRNTKYARCVNPKCEKCGREYILKDGKWHKKRTHKKATNPPEKNNEDAVPIMGTNSPNDSSDPSDAVTSENGTENSTHCIKPLTPPECGDFSDDSSVPMMGTNEESHEAAALLLAIAGSDDEFIEMIPQPQKYTTVHQPLTQDDMLAHLAGEKTIGGRCFHPGGMTRAVCFDGDTEQESTLIRQSARKLAMVGYLPLLDAPPEGRPSLERYHKHSLHLWAVFDAPVQIAAAYADIYRIAPELETLKEHWPVMSETPRGTRVRLPGGKYVMPGYSGWCQITNVASGETCQAGEGVARLLVRCQTPASIVPPYVPPDPPPATTSDGEDSSTSIMRSGEIDETWRTKYGAESGLWFAFTSRQVAAWYNHRHSLDEIRPRERNGMVLSPNGDERTASTHYRMTPEGERYTDFSRHGLRPDGSRDGGDALELTARVSGKSKGELLRQAARELLQEARNTLESAATQGNPWPAWIDEIITDAGRAHYEQIRATHGAMTGFSPCQDEQVIHDVSRQGKPHRPTLLEMEHALWDYAGKVGYASFRVGKIAIGAGLVAYREAWYRAKRDDKRQIYDYIVGQLSGEV